MSEQLLEIFIQLFALLARLDGVGKRERDKMSNLLYQQLNREVVSKYMALFDKYCKKHTSRNTTSLQEITDVAKRINGQITQQQKIVLISELTQLVYADHVLSDKEKYALKNISRALHIDEAELKLIQQLITAKNIEDLDSVNMLIVSSHPDTVPPKCFHMIPEGYIHGFVAILKLKSIRPFFMRYFGRATIFLNQTPLNSSRIVVVPPGSTLRSSRFKAIYYSDFLKYFQIDQLKTDITFLAEDVHFEFNGGTPGLQGITIAEKSGTLVGVMGASGSGKSTLFNVLNGHEKPSAGSVLINNIDIHKEPGKIEGVMGFVPQDDLLMEDLTVYQNMYYAAKLCFGNLANTEINNLVDQTLYNLGLYEIKDLKIGTSLQNTISGGQRKRLNIGLELLREPMVLYVDEPTSGLSSRDSENIMDLLKELTLRGKLIFVVIHQPSSDIFKMFDKLIILDVGGYPIYNGHPVEAVAYFRDAARLIDKQSGSCLECGNVNVEQIFNIVETRLVDEYGHQTDQRKVTPKTWNEIYKEKIDVQPIKMMSSPPKPMLDIPSKVKQLTIFMIRDIRSKMANRQYMLINLLEAPLLAVILAVLVRFFPEGARQTRVYIFQENVNIPAYIFMAIIVALFMGLTVSAEEIIKDRKIRKRESFLHLSKSSYLASKLLLLFVMSLIQTGTFVLVGNMILSIKGMYPAYWLVLFSTSFFANVVGLNISSAFNSAVTIYILIPILLIPQILLSGVVVQFDQLNPLFGAKVRVPFIGDLMASRWAYEGLMVHQFKDNRYEKLFYDVDKQLARTDYNTVYYLPRLKYYLEYAFANRDSQDPMVKHNLTLNFTILKNEIARMQAQFGQNEFNDFMQLKAENIDSSTYSATKNFISTIEKIQVKRHLMARKEKDLRIAKYTASPHKASIFQQLKRDYTNEKVTSQVFDNNEKTRILEYDGHLVQQIYPIFADPDPVHFFDFRTLFFLPEKYFAGRLFDTLYFNTFIIWSMTIFLIIMLYYDVLRSIVNFMSKLDQKKS